MATHKLIESKSVGSGGAASIEFTSIPQTYTDLVLLVSGRCSDAAYHASTKLIFNSGSGNDSRFLYGDATGISVGTFSAFVGIDTASNGTSNTFGSTRIYIPNYTGSAYKSFIAESVSENNFSSGGTYQMFASGIWQNTAAITTVTISYIFGGNYTQYSTASLYGIKNS